MRSLVWLDIAGSNSEHLQRAMRAETRNAPVRKIALSEVFRELATSASLSQRVVLASACTRRTMYGLGSQDE